MAEAATQQQQRLITLANKLLLHRQNEPSADATQFLMQALPLFAQLKALHRDTCIQSLQARSSTNEARVKMDRAQLELQNLIYQQQHLEAEIIKCNEYESQYQNLPLYTEEEFRSLAQQNGTELPDDGHDFTLARLQHELSERQLLETRKKALLSEKSKLTKENADKKAALDVLENQLEEFVTSAKGIQKKMEQL